MMNRVTGFAISLLVHGAVFGAALLVWNRTESESPATTVRMCLSLKTRQPPPMPSTPTPPKPEPKTASLPQPVSTPKAVVTPPEPQPTPPQKTPPSPVNEMVPVAAPQKALTETTLEEVNQTVAEMPVMVEEASAPVAEAAEVFDAARWEADYRQSIAEVLRQYLNYPIAARKRGIEGVVKVRFTLLPDGTVTDISVEQSVHGILRHATVRTVEEASGHLPIPAAEIELTVPLRYHIK